MTQDAVVVGLGFVGLTLAVHIASRGTKVVGVESDQEKLELIAAGQPHFYEPGLDEALRCVITEGTLSVMNRLPEGKTTYVITIGTPLLDGAPLEAPIYGLMESICGAAAEGALIILRSTVVLGTTEKLVKLCASLGREDLKLSFCPERTIEGAALKELETLPQIVSADDLDAVEHAAQFFGQFSASIVECPSSRTGEMAKLAANVYRDMRFATANAFAALCSASGINYRDVVTIAGKDYPRLDLPMSGPVGGPCLSKDTYLLSQPFDCSAAAISFLQSGRKVNESLGIEVVRVIGAWLAANESVAQISIALVGVTFKPVPETSDVRGSTAIDIFEALRNQFPTEEIVIVDDRARELDAYFPGVPVYPDFKGVANRPNVIVYHTPAAYLKADLEKYVAEIDEAVFVYQCWANSLVVHNPSVTLTGLGTPF